MSKQRFIPYLAYRDAPAAIAFLVRAFGFAELSRYVMDDGRIGHAEVSYQDQVLYLASVYEGFGASPLDLASTHGQIYCIVDDVDAHYAQAKAAGATLVGEPMEQHGSRMYRAFDPEGHRWLFAQPLEDA